MTFQERLVKMDACEEACDWIGRKSLKTAWAECGRPDWMLWLACRTESVDVGLVVRCACDFARSVLKYVPKEETRPLRAIEAAERWIENRTVKTGGAAGGAAGDAASYAARDAAWAASDAAWAASDAAWAALDAARAARNAARAASYAARDAAWAASYAARDAARAASYNAAGDAAGDAARAASYAAFCKIIRKRIPYKLLEAAYK